MQQRFGTTGNGVDSAIEVLKQAGYNITIKLTPSTETHPHYAYYEHDVVVKPGKKYMVKVGPTLVEVKHEEDRVVVEIFPDSPGGANLVDGITIKFDELGH